MTAPIKLPTSALVTGGAGFIGSNLVEALVAGGCRLTVLDNESTGRSSNLDSVLSKIRYLKGDIREENVVRAAMEGAEAVFHVAAIPSVPRSVREPELSCDVNILGTLRILEAARKVGIRTVVISSSSSVYGETETLPKHEEIPPSPLSPYAVGKLSAEMLGKVYHSLHGLSVVSLRYFNVFGPRQDPASEYAAVIPRFISCLKEGKPPTIFGDGNQTRDFTYVADVVRANLLAASTQKAAGSVVNVAGGRQTSVNELATTIARLLRSPVKPTYLEARAGDILHSYASVRKAKEILDWTPEVSLEDGLDRTIDWFLQAQSPT